MRSRVPNGAESNTLAYLFAHEINQRHHVYVSVYFRHFKYVNAFSKYLIRQIVNVVREVYVNTLTYASMYMSTPIFIRIRYRIMYVWQ